MKRECETCIKRKTLYCPTSIDCMATDDMPYYQNRIMLLEENQELKKQLEEKILESSYFDMITDENIELKKQLEEKTKIGISDHKYASKCEDKVITMENQQKEFIEYLEKEKDRLAISTSHTYEDSLGKTRLVNEDIYNEVDKILSKYREIVRENKYD